MIDMIFEVYLEVKHLLCVLRRDTQSVIQIIPKSLSRRALMQRPRHPLVLESHSHSSAALLVGPQP